MHKNSGNILPQSLGGTSQLKETNIELIHEEENQALYNIQNLQKQPDSKTPHNAFTMQIILTIKT